MEAAFAFPLMSSPPFRFFDTQNIPECDRKYHIQKKPSCLKNRHKSFFVYFLGSSQDLSDNCLHAIAFLGSRLLAQGDDALQFPVL